MTITLDWVLWFLAAVSFGLAAFRVRAPIDFMCLGFMFAAITFLTP
jgi:hypothetical protein